MTFLDKIKGSLYNPTAYHEVQDFSISTLLRFYYKLATFVGLWLVILFSIFHLFPILRVLSYESLHSFVARFPENLVITVKDGIATSNAEEPYSVTASDIFGTVPLEKNVASLRDTPFIILNTKDNFSLEIAEKYPHTLILFKNALVTTEDKSSLRVQTLKNIPTLTINRTSLERFVSTLRPFLPYILPLILVGIFIATLVTFSFNLIFFFLIALLILLLGKLKGVRLTYAKAYRTALYASIPPIILLSLFPSLLGIKFLFTLLLLIVAHVNLKEPELPTLVSPLAPPTA